MAEKRQTIKLHEATAENDIKFRGPLGPVHFKALGWFCIVLSQVGVLMTLGMQVDPSMMEMLFTPRTIIGFIAPLSLPLLMIVNFSTILTQEDYRDRLFLNGAAALGLAGLFVLIYNRYIAGIASVFTEQGLFETRAILERFFFENSDSGFIAFNLFIDLFLCTLFVFFLLYRPKRFFTGKKILIFRALAVLPVVYELASITLKYLSASGRLVLPIDVFPFLTAKPPMMFFVFLLSGIYLKVRERRFCKGGRTYEEYREFLMSNRNSWHFARFLAITLLIAGVLDVLVLIVSGSVHMAVTNFAIDGAIDPTTITEEQLDAMAIDSLEIAQLMGFGESVALIAVAPLMLLFSYTRSAGNYVVSIAIPATAIALIILVYLEALLMAVQMAPTMLGAMLG